MRHHHGLHCRPDSNFTRFSLTFSLWSRLSPGPYLALSSHVPLTFSCLGQPLSLACFPGSWHLWRMPASCFAERPCLMCVSDVISWLGWAYTTLSRNVPSQGILSEDSWCRCLVSGDVSLAHLGLSKWIEWWTPKRYYGHILIPGTGTCELM